MGELVCKFQGERIGDHIEQHYADIQPATPPIVLTGLYRTDARYVAQGMNLQHRYVVRIAIVRDTAAAMSAEADRLQQLVGRVADFVIMEGEDVLRFGSGWMLLPVPTPRLLDGFGGRFAQGWELTFAGDAPIEEYTGE